jgi:D-glycero-D-manno-heptose 1,7-bisphosphate phosphatase
MTKHIVLDRDGTLIKYVPYLCDPNKVELIELTTEAIKVLKENDYKIHLHTNQSGVSRGYFNMNDVEKCNEIMIDKIGLGSDIFEYACIATDYPPGINSYRKPSPKYGFEIIKKHNINSDSLIYVGDSISDLKTAKNIGCDAFGVMSGGYDLINLMKSEIDLNYKVFPNLFEVVKYLIKSNNIK